MPRLLSGGLLRTGGSGDFITLAGAQPQLPPTDSTSTGFTLITDSLLRTRYASSLGNIEFKNGTMYSSMPDPTIKILATGTVIVSTSTNTGALVVEGGVGIGANLYVEDDIVVNGITIGRGFEGINNIVIKGVADPQINAFNEGQQSIVIGYDAHNGLNTSYKNIAIGRYALNSGTNLSNTIAIGDSALKDIGSINELFVGNIESIAIENPVVLTVTGHGLSTGTHVIVRNAVGTTELNGGIFYIDAVTPDTVALYFDNILNQPVDGTTYMSYAGSGTLARILLRNNNIAIGVDAAKSLIDGELNFFFGDRIAENLTTGSNNFFIGHEVASNMTSGSGNIAIGGDNLVDGVDNQVNIGSVFYFDGIGYATINAETTIGLGSDSTGTNNGALMVVGGAGMLGNLYIGGHINVTGTGTSLIQDVVIDGSITAVGAGSINLSPESGDVTISPEAGSLTIFPDVFASGSMNNVTIGNSVARNGTFLDLSADNLNITSTATSTSTSTGASIVTQGGIGVAKDVYAAGSIYSAEGIAEEAGLLYTPRVTISIQIPPENPRIGDFWIEPTLGAEFQYIADGENRIWVQFTSL